MQSLRPIRRALLSLSDKQGLLPFAQALHAQGITLLSTGGTARLLIEAGLPITEIAAYTGYPEMMDGRLKTLHPKIHGGILGRRDCDAEIMAHHQILPIDLVVVNFYPFAQTIAEPQTTLEQSIENIDIGGPTMVRAAAKNYRDVAVVVESADYPQLLAQLEAHQGSLPLSTRFNLACKAFAYTAAYDQAIAEYWANQCIPIQQKMTLLSAEPNLPQHLTLHLIRQQPLRYGENQHQKGAFYKTAHSQPAGLISAQQLQGKPLSYNNLLDADTALCGVQSFVQPACMIVKHANPCGVALGTTLLEAYQGAFNSDPSSAFGGIIACNRILDLETVQCVLQQQFVEVIIAPAIAPAALSLCASKPNLRLLVCDTQQPNLPAALDYRSIQGGFLVQERDQGLLSIDDLQVVTARAPSEAEINDALFGWKVIKFVKSNAIIYAKDNQTLGIGAGQMSRVYSAKIAALKAAEQNLPLAGAIMASDAFFPFRDVIDTAAQVGITCVIQPGGSLRDAEVINAANQHGMAMIYTGMRHFRH